MKIYRSHNGLFLGVCMGLEESLGIPARYSRLILIILAIIFRAWIILGLYLLAAILMPIRSGEDWKIQDNFETLSRDARHWSRREYNEIREMLRRAAGSKYNSEADFEEEPAAEKKPKPSPRGTAKTSGTSKRKPPTVKDESPAEATGENEADKV